MEQQEVDRLLLQYASKYPPEMIPHVRQMLQQLDADSAYIRLAQTKDPMIAILLSVLLGCYGVDRFYAGDILLGALKLITCGGCGIWWLIDIFLIMNVIKQKNYMTLTFGYNATGM